MKIPTKIKLIGCEYKIQYVNRVDEHDSWANVCYRTQLIQIKKDIGDENKKVSFLHELFHLFFEKAGMEHNERNVQLFSEFMYQLLPQILE